MKKIYLLFAAILLNMHLLFAQVPFNRGVNLGNWFQSARVRDVHFTKYTRQDFLNIKSLGCDVVRLPINMYGMSSGAPDYKLDPMFFSMLDTVITWSETLKMYILIDNHAFDSVSSSDRKEGSKLLRVWEQIAEHYKQRSDYVLYEILNEPHNISTHIWGEIEQQVIKSIRSKDTRHTIIVGASDYNRYSELKNLPVFKDNNLIYTFHFYDPFLFTHQGAGWTGMQSISGIPFPYNNAQMPARLDSLELSPWLDSLIIHYPIFGNVATVKSLIDEAIRFRDSKKVKIYCGEFGVYIPKSNKEERVFWYEVVRKYFEANKISWTMWDYDSGFGLFTKPNGGHFEHDLNVPLLEALGLNNPYKK